MSQINLHHHETCSFLRITSPVTQTFSFDPIFLFRVKFITLAVCPFVYINFPSFLRSSSLLSSLHRAFSFNGEGVRVMRPNHRRWNYFDCSLDIIYSLTHFINSFLYVVAFISYQLSHTRHAKEKNQNRFLQKDMGYNE